jgi:hypothetical protein
MTGSVPQGSEKGSKEGKRKPLGTKSTNLSEERRDSAATTRASKQQNVEEVKAVVKPKAVKKLKSDLLKPVSLGVHFFIRTRRIGLTLPFIGESSSYRR